MNGYKIQIYIAIQLIGRTHTENSLLIVPTNIVRLCFDNANANDNGRSSLKKRKKAKILILYYRNFLTSLN